MVAENSTGCCVDDGKISFPSKVVIFCGSVVLVAIGDGSIVENGSNLDDCSERGEDGRSVGVASEGVRDEGRSGTVLSATMLSVMDGGGRGSPLAVGRGAVSDGNTISGRVAVDIGRKVTVTSEPEPRYVGKARRRWRERERERESSPK